VGLEERLMEEIKTINEKITHMEETNPVQAAIDQV
jgi:hypothetical protein